MYSYNKAIDILTNEFPSLKSIYEDNIDDYEDLPYVFYESVFVKYIVDKVRTRNEMDINFIFDFIENLLLYGDEKTKNLVDVAVIESLYHENDFVEFNEFLSKYYGNLTKKSFDDCIDSNK